MPRSAEAQPWFRRSVFSTHAFGARGCAPSNWRARARRARRVRAPPPHAGRRAPHACVSVSATPASHAIHRARAFSPAGCARSDRAPLPPPNQPAARDARAPVGSVPLFYRAPRPAACVLLPAWGVGRRACFAPPTPPAASSDCSILRHRRASGGLHARRSHPATRRTLRSLPPCLPRPPDLTAALNPRARARRHRLCVCHPFSYFSPLFAPHHSDSFFPASSSIDSCSTVFALHSPSSIIPAPSCIESSSPLLKYWVRRGTISQSTRFY